MSRSRGSSASNSRELVCAATCDCGSIQRASVSGLSMARKRGSAAAPRAASAGGGAQAGTTREEDTVSPPSPLRIRAAELFENPDRIGFILVRRIYEAFGLREDRIPSEYDRKAQRLLLTD